ncbi:carbohydrate ABC transporter substrate-binding protein [Salipaludibacillus agaradhaerens]|uniref:Carbohydrate ABC transporter substrate-binding protein n=1 Tax=Salipaludibacillus agaradhaerens TaxID=76935 RepID=A0A9Q4AYT5_SALAG|nr:ABC transporter substrate-binding protein [Salipaludibacillus agaradhaerens]MCR6095030.1 carbohydrate ABC transporter substrate-binding protein [Salipaludibacillus agaradhaerens]MCR6115412.1 carbohydrate ABC transporter substrate-binding protein [Salipaludibacillus agaradhaerens]
MKTFSKVLTVPLTMVVLAACGNGDNANGDSDNVTLSLYSTLTEETAINAVEEVIEEFEDEYPHISIDANFPADSYEDSIRVRMSSNDLPDLFDTHGWAKNRYGDYVADLSDMEWVADFDESMEPLLKDEDGKVYAFPLNQANDGIMYNATLLEELNIDLPETVDEWIEAMETIRDETDNDVSPLWIPGNDPYAIGQILDQFSTPLLVTDEENNYEEELLDGTFDWSNYTLLPETMMEIKEKDLMNVDALTASPSQRAQLMAQNLIGFTFADGAFGRDVYELNPDIQVGTMPMPAFHEGDEPSWIGGERHTLAAYEDSDNLEEAKLFIEFMAQPDNARKVAEGTTLPAGINGVDADNYYAEYYEKWSHIDIQPYFDRVYLPGGMWDVYATTGSDLIAESITPEDASEIMEAEYHRLRRENNEDDGNDLNEEEAN